MIHDFMLKWSVKLTKTPLFMQSVAEQKEYIDKFKHPKTLRQRSFYQYKAQMVVRSFIVRFLYNVASLPVLIFYMLHIKFFNKELGKYDAVYDLDGSGMTNVIPNSLKEEFLLIKSTKETKPFLTIKDKAYLLKLIFRYPLSGFFLFKVALKIRRIRGFISSYHPRAIIVCNEFSFTSSLLTDFCNKNEVELINVMHGEKLFNIRDSFFKFNRCYIWSEFYKELFAELRADSEQFIVEVPSSLLFKKKTTDKTVDFTYYLQAQYGEGLEVIVRMLTKLQENGYTVAIRPHPRYTNLEELNRYIGGHNIEVEKCKEFSIEDSILRTKNVISIYSTVLQQAYYNGSNAVIDDISDVEMINKLVDLHYVMLKMDNKRLSDIIGAH